MADSDGFAFGILCETLVLWELLQDANVNVRALPSPAPIAAINASLVNPFVLVSLSNKLP